MKKKISIIICVTLFLINSVSGQQDSIKEKQVVKVELAKENSTDNTKMEIEFLSQYLTVSSFLVGVISVLFAIFFFVAINIGTKRFKELSEQYKALKKTFNEDSEDFKNKIELKQTDAFKKINEHVNNINLIKEEILSINEKLNGNQNYIYQGLEQYFHLQYSIIEHIQDKKLLAELTRKQGIIYTFSQERKVCFAGITILMNSGKLEDVIYLESIKNNKSWDDELRFIAHDAIKKIKDEK